MKRGLTRRFLCALLCAALLIPACAALAETEGEKKALECALDYLDVLYFSREGLYYQLLYEEYTPEEAAWAIGQLDSVDWYDQAAGSAGEMVEYFPDISPLDLGQTLLNSGFTADEARYGSAAAFGEPAEKPAVTPTPVPLPEGTIPPYLTEDHPELDETPAPEAGAVTPEPAETPVPETATETAQSRMTFGPESRRPLPCRSCPRTPPRLRRPRNLPKITPSPYWKPCIMRRTSPKSTGTAGWSSMSP